MSRVFRMSAASVYPHYVAKVEKKGRTQAELDEVIRWLTGFDDPVMRQIRYLDKIVDKLAKGRPMGKVLRA